MNKWLSPLLVVAVLCFVQSAAVCAPSESFKQAVSDYNAGKYQQALSEFGAHSATKPGDALAHYYLALCHQALNHRTQAQAEYEWVAQRGDATLRAHAAKGLQVLASGRASRASSTPIASSSAGQTAPALPAANAPSKVKKILKWSATWCQPCQIFAPVYDATKPKFRDISFQELDLDDDANAGLKSQYSVNSVPRLIFLDAGGKVLYNGGANSEPGWFENQINKFR